MKLAELSPKFMTIDEKRVGLVFLCPICKGTKQNNPDDHCHHVGVRFSNPLDGAPAYPRGWHRTGETLETITLAPSIMMLDGCKWHGFVENGELKNA